MCDVVVSCRVLHVCLRSFVLGLFVLLFDVWLLFVCGIVIVGCSCCVAVCVCLLAFMCLCVMSVLIVCVWCL